MLKEKEAIKITVLGSGGFGYPLTFCNCQYCKNARLLKDKNIRKRASLLINDEMLIDLTPDCQVSMNMYNKDMSNIKYLLQTHTHLDHFDLNQFITLDFKYGSNRKTHLNLICSNLCLADIQNKVSQYEKMDLFDENYLEKIHLSNKTIDHGESIQIDDYYIKAIHCTHDEKIGSQIYLIKQNNKSILYATDTSKLTSTALQELKGEKLDCVFLDEPFGENDYMFAHLNIKGFDEYIKTLQSNNILNNNCLVYATHITHDGNPLHDDLEKILNQNGYCVSFDGMEFEL